MRAVQLNAFGDPVAGLECVDIPEPNNPGPGQVLIRVEYAPVNPSDLMVARGIYSFRPPLPSVIGNEGVGTVIFVGANVSNVKVGDVVIAPLSSLTWREKMLIPAEGLVPLPAEADRQQLAMLGINPPTAALCLSEFVDLNPGAWVVQNAANSGVGRWVIAFAKARGLRTVNIVRRPELTGELKEIGADVVVVDGPDVVDQIQNAIGDVQIRLALDGVGGTATGVLASIVSRGGTIVMYSAMSEAAITINPLDLIFKLVTLSGFHMAHPKFASKIPLACKQAAEMIEAKKMRVPVAAVYDITAIKDAVAHAGRGGKVLLKVNNSGIF